MTKSRLFQERRRYRRFLLDLPLEYRVSGVPGAYGGIALNCSKTGFLVHFLQELPVGTRLKIVVLFADEFQLTSFEAIGEIVRRVDSGNGQKARRYGIKLLQINTEDYLKLRHLLSGQPEWVNMDTGAVSVQNWSRNRFAAGEKKMGFRSIFLDRLKIR
jgi:hypothetical protein